MKQNTAKIINLEEFIRARTPLKLDEATNIVNFIQDEMPKADEAINELLVTKHGLKIVEGWQQKILKYELALRRVSRFLSQAENGKANDNQQEAEQLAKQCASLVSWNKELKTLVADDAKKRAENDKKNEIDPMKVAGFLIGTPVGVQKVVEAFITNDVELLKASGEVGLILGAYLAFAKQIHIAARDATMPKGFKKSAVAIAVVASITAKNIDDIQPQEPARLARRPTMAIVARI